MISQFIGMCMVIKMLSFENPSCIASCKMYMEYRPINEVSFSIPIRNPQVWPFLAENPLSVKKSPTLG
jgi:hypothetical protein